jgi:hypothetical protein
VAGDAAATTQGLRVLSREDTAAEVAATVSALGALRTTLRPILDKDWTVALRDGLDPVTQVLAAVHRIDGQMLVGCRAQESPPALTLLDSLRTTPAHRDRPRARAATPGRRHVASALSLTDHANETVVSLAHGSLNETPTRFRGF